jgi:hypothetical protein
LDITEAYGNVLIDILCRELKKEGVRAPSARAPSVMEHGVGKASICFFNDQDVTFIRGKG